MLARLLRLRVLRLVMKARNDYSDAFRHNAENDSFVRRPPTDKLRKRLLRGVDINSVLTSPTA